LIDAQHITKRYGEKVAVDDMTFTVRPGVVTGFLGPNGSGKSTTMRLILGLDALTEGSVTVNGRHYRDHPAPLHEVGVLLEAHSIHTGRSAFDHLLALAQTHGIPRSRVQELIELVGLNEVARKRVGQFSVGMGQRLGIASALLGDPQTVILDEPINGLDPEGIHWIRELLRTLAAEGRTVFLSSHLMNEMALSAEHLIIVGRGRLIRDVSVADFVAEHSKQLVRVRSPQASELRETVLGPDVRVSSDERGVLEVEGLTSDQIGKAAARNGLVLHELTPHQASLEEAFMELTHDEIEYRTTTPPSTFSATPTSRKGSPHEHLSPSYQSPTRKHRRTGHPGSSLPLRVDKAPLVALHPQHVGGPPRSSLWGSASSSPRSPPRAGTR
jgi:ABC-2 type transport system ATP-binding protein